jgi:hypothetical protein
MVFTLFLKVENRGYYKPEDIRYIASERKDFDD